MDRCKHRDKITGLDTLYQLKDGTVHCKICGAVIKPLTIDDHNIDNIKKIINDYYNLVETINIMNMDGEDESINNFLDSMLADNGINSTMDIYNKALNKLENTSLFKNPEDMSALEKLAKFKEIMQTCRIR